MLPWTAGLAAGATAPDATKRLKVLAIGNSFSQDALEHLYHIAADAGIDEIVLANLYIGGATLAQHWQNARTGAPAYRYDKNDNGTWRSEPNRTLLYGLLDEDWDLITLQQASGYSGIAASYREEDVLRNLIEYVNAHKTNPAAKLGWHMTWAYQADSTHASFPNYGRDQWRMYAAIVNAVRTEVLPTGAFSVLIPSGTAIQNVRTSFIGDTLTRDGYHLSYNLGRYIAGLTWLHAVTGLPLDGLTYVPSDAEIPPFYLPVIKEAVAAAVANPFAVTISSYVEAPPIDYSRYTLLDWEPVGCAYWNSRDSRLHSTLISRENSTASNLCYFVSSGRMFTREDIPVGSIIEVDAGYQYRPEGWITLGLQPARESPVTTSRVFVTEAWWGDYQYRAFNVSVVGSSTDIRNAVAETAAKFRIWVPK